MAKSIFVKNAVANHCQQLPAGLFKSLWCVISEVSMWMPVDLFPPTYTIAHICELATFLPVLQVLHYALFHYYDPSDSKDAFRGRLIDSAPPKSVLCLKFKRHVLYSDDWLTASCMCVIWVKFGFKGNFYVEGRTAKMNPRKNTNPNLKPCHLLLMAYASSVPHTRTCSA